MGATSEGTLWFQCTMRTELRPRNPPTGQVDPHQADPAAWLSRLSASQVRKAAQSYMQHSFVQDKLPLLSGFETPAVAIDTGQRRSRTLSQASTGGAIP